MTDSTSSVSKAKKEVEDTADALKGRAKSAYDSAKNKVESEVSDLRDRAGNRVHDAKNSVADRFDSTAERLDDAAQNMTDGSPQSQAAHRVAYSVSHAAQTLRETELATLGDDLNHMARRHPVAFAGVAALAGFALGRFLKSSGNTTRARNDERTTHRGSV
ncbi:hypothetical protein OO012_11340 [Rhodobacteraceae bacterium KMM 6894]|nr:hypothetical protein [Rhodobacteraceae bacterium KMM 6894]